MRKDQKQKNDQAARLISTSKLHVLPHFHTWPINVVVFNEPSGGYYPTGYLILEWASRLDAFSRITSYNVCYTKLLRRCKVISSSYQSRLELERSISMIRETAHLSDCICDMNVRPSQPYFQILSEAECFYFQLIGLKREIIFTRNNFV